MYRSCLCNLQIGSKQWLANWFAQKGYIKITNDTECVSKTHNWNLKKRAYFTSIVQTSLVTNRNEDFILSSTDNLQDPER